MGFKVVLDKVTKKKGTSMYKLAQDTGCKPNALSVTKHKGYDPKLSTLLKWASVLKCPITDLFEWDGKIEKAAKPAKKAGGSKKKATKKK